MGCSSCERGMTLIEVMVVIVIITIVTTFAIPSLQQKTIVNQSATRLLAIMNAAADSAILTNTEVGLQLGSEGYQFFRWDEVKSQWLSITDDTTLRPRQWPSGLQRELMVSGQEVFISSGRVTGPQIIFFPMGTITPFDLNLVDDQALDRYQISATGYGKIGFVDEILR